MEAIYALNGVSYLTISLIAFFIYYSFCKREEISCKVGSIIGIVGIFFLLMSMLNLLWVFGSLEPNGKDFLLLSAVLAVVSGVLILYAVYKMTGNKNLVYLLVMFLTAIFAINFSIKSFLIVTLGLSQLLLAIVFLELAYFSNYHLKKAGIAGIAYSAVSLILLALMHFGKESHRLFWFVPNFLLFAAFLLIYLDVKNVGILRKEKYRQRKFGILDYAAVLGKFLVFIVSISGFILVSSISIHELGHALVAQYYGCGQFKAVIYDVIAPHTEINCGAQYNNVILTLAGVAATLAVGMLFMLTGTNFTKGLSYLLFGFGLLISFGDLVDLGISMNIITMVMLLSLIIILISVVKISVYYLKQQEIFIPEEQKKAEKPQKGAKK